MLVGLQLQQQPTLLMAAMPQPPPQQQPESQRMASTGLLQAVQQPSTGLYTLQLGLLAHNTQIPAVVAPVQTVQSACRTVTGQHTQLLPNCSIQPATLQQQQQQHNGLYGRSMASVVPAPYPTEQHAVDGQDGKHLACSGMHAIFQGWMPPQASCLLRSLVLSAKGRAFPPKNLNFSSAEWHHHALANIE